VTAPFRSGFGGGAPYRAPHQNDPALQPLIDGMSAKVEEMPAGYQHAPNIMGGGDMPMAQVPADPYANEAYPLGMARAQLHETYVVAQTGDGIVIVDQHAAHERLVYERMKDQMKGQGVPRQTLLIPDIVDLGEDDAARVLTRMDELAEMGLIIEPFGTGAVAVRETPALLGEMDVQGLLRDLADDLSEYDEALSLKERFEHVCQMEATPHSGQCNHGRPTYVELKLADIERLFGRR